MISIMTLWHYWRARRLRFSSRQALERFQSRQLKRFAGRVLANSPYFRPFRDLPLNRWPLMDKALMMAHFDQMNTAGLKRDQLLACAQRSEAERDFTPRIGRFSVGLSSGTSGQRGVFVVSPQEQQIWAGGMLAKMLPDGIFAGERVALFLRADNNLYHSVDNRWLSLDFYDLFSPFIDQLPRLQTQAPTLIVAPAQVLRALALAVLNGQIQLDVKKVISVAEVLDAQDRQLLMSVFREVGEVYQATEGFLGATCSHGTLHLNEEFVHIEPQWLDEYRFTPVITDFTRSTQPIVRYRLDDVLVRQPEPCPCGQHSMAIARIEGRRDDQLLLPDHQGQMQVIFADLCSRAIANALPLTSDYRLIQLSKTRLDLIADCTQTELEHGCKELVALFAQQGIAVEKLEWQLTVQAVMPAFDRKRRRIVRQAEA
ncbi:MULTISPECIES: F390 synthetase-related protein [Pseudomonas syringae group]|uniref:CoF synthetase n=3 Tax=Pseudomonas syringae group TaxID=136849 RepID=A0AAD0M5X4_9PSED|nr:MULTISPECIES: F390 synthetase-related protein [Pseudomonas syringae group]AVB22801.1 CoF synthetase [Pseudomonas avellanae]EGH13940.1 putative adenylate-forming enzyme [Pseudomonas amygdali pv. morsprunorum str. M302280]KWS69222.1 CoF synthetase [Pseudomonas amygdali pv. morsprunorum]PHN36334.1 CoF synthetase [Pseudomonas avellanae]POC83178.1 CoF synthetase [Pseudomonas avellanae]